ncbi:MAG: hypothetical protein JNN26_14340 [Candidatus Obscuribacter sp.]|nr:hypothetical protein [Candidatus Obscuribacter sp.]
MICHESDSNSNTHGALTVIGDLDYSSLLTLTSRSGSLLINSGAARKTLSMKTSSGTSPTESKIPRQNKGDTSNIPLSNEVNRRRAMADQTRLTCSGVMVLSGDAVVRSASQTQESYSNHLNKSKPFAN